MLEAYSAHNGQSVNYTTSELIEMFKAEYVRIKPNVKADFDKSTKSFSSQTYSKRTGLSYCELVELCGGPKPKAGAPASLNSVSEYDVNFRKYLSQVRRPTLEDFSNYLKERKLPAPYTFVHNLGYEKWTELLKAYGRQHVPSTQLTKDELIEQFKAEYSKIQPVSMLDFNARTTEHNAQIYCKAAGIR